MQTDIWVWEAMDTINQLVKHPVEVHCAHCAHRLADMFPPDEFPPDKFPAVELVRESGAYKTKELVRTSTICFCVPFGLLFEKTFEFFEIRVI